MGQTADQYFVFETAGGFCGIAWNEVGIRRFQLPARSPEATGRNLLRRLPGAVPGTPPQEVLEAVNAAKRYFAGEQIDFFAFPARPRRAGRFFQDHLRSGAACRLGSYDDLRHLGARSRRRSEAARDVGQAMARNPVPLIIPCHRVLAAGGKVGGFSAPGGSDAKIRMLELEGVRVGPPESAQQSLGL